MSTKLAIRLADEYQQALKGQTEDLEVAIHQSLEEGFDAILGDLEDFYNGNKHLSSLEVQTTLRRSEKLAQLLRAIEYPGQYESHVERFTEAYIGASEQGAAMGSEIPLVRGASAEDIPSDDFSDVPFDAIVAQARDGADRLRNHQQTFIQGANAAVIESLVRGSGTRELKRQLREHLGKTKSKADQIARTEMVSALNTAAEARYARGNIKYFQSIATPSTTLCPFCAARNGNVYKLGDASIPYHPSGRCTSVAWDPKWQKGGGTDDTFIEKYRADRIAELRALGYEPNYGVAPFEKMAGRSKPPKPFWIPGQAVKKTRKPRKKKAPTPTVRQTDRPHERPVSQAQFKENAEFTYAPFIAEMDKLAQSKEAIALPTLRKQLNDASRAWARETKGTPAKARLLEEYDRISKKVWETREALYSKTDGPMKALHRALLDRGPTTEQFNEWYQGIGGAGVYELLLAQGYTGRDPELMIRSVYKLLNGAPGRAEAGSGNKSLREFVVEGKRAWAQATTGKLNMTYSINFDTLAHEMGHFAEFSDRRYGKAAEEWVRSRASIQETVPLSNLIPGANYGAEEVAYPDEFISPYVGKKYYAGHTEVLSMGVEKFTNSGTMAEFFLADRDHFMFVLGVLEDL